MIPPMEIDEGAVEVLETSFGATQDETINVIARGPGFRSTGSQLRDLIVSRIALKKVEGNVLERDGNLTLQATALP
ncbi:hypothetical protein BTR14_06510 [Rhizobium rhizosphaerae]|uniref:Uncharacterized protein n=1 Tax=Xaviernesmea rhizosphaerae TaxID=1672749 RepID=A0ABX3PFA1_9HYPH|nr:hypothetical protein BTR14_06510 [Xaviernesmea rhizosphaerae]